MSAPLWGQNLVRLLHLDESVTSADASFLLVAGIIVHGDRQWPKINERIAALADKYISPAYRARFVFHATDIFHGKRYWRDVDPKIRLAVLIDLAKIIDD